MRYITSIALFVALIASPLTPRAAGIAQGAIDLTVDRQAPGPGPQAAPSGIPANIRLDLAITDTYGGSPSKKTVTMLIRSGQGGRIRTANNLAGAEVKLNVDAIVRSHRVSANGPTWMEAQVTFEYTPAQQPTVEGARTFPAQLHESIDVVLLDGKPLVVSQSADPATDRRVTVELTATMQR
jgi:hypothetical protein